MITLRPGSRTLVVGRTGSGKSGLSYHLVREYHKRYPGHGIIIVNPKFDEGWNGLLPPTETYSPTFKPGMLLNWAVLPGQEEEVEEFLWDVYLAGRKGNPTLIVYDEGADVGHNLKPLNALFTQGRALKIAVLYLTQRPARIPVYAPTQADDFIIFNLLGKADRERLEEYMYEVNLTPYMSPSAAEKLVEFHAVRYNIPTATTEVISPVDYDISPLQPVKPAKKFLKYGVLVLLLTIGAKIL